LPDALPISIAKGPGARPPVVRPKGKAGEEAGRRAAVDAAGRVDGCAVAPADATVLGVARQRFFAAIGGDAIAAAQPRLAQARLPGARIVEALAAIAIRLEPPFSLAPVPVASAVPATAIAVSGVGLGAAIAAARVLACIRRADARIIERGVELIGNVRCGLARTSG